MSALYELAASHRALADKLNDLDLDDQTIADTLESESGDLMEKGTNVAKVFRNLESFAAQIKEAETHMAARRKAVEKRAESLKAYLKTNMEIAGISKIESPWFVISIKQNPESVQIDDALFLPKDYMRETISYAPDKKMIAAAIKEGFSVPGASITRSTRIEIK